MAGKEDGPSKANGVSKSEDKGKEKVDDVKDQKDEAQAEKSADGKAANGEKILPPGTNALRGIYVLLDADEVCRGIKRGGSEVER